MHNNTDFNLISGGFAVASPLYSGLKQIKDKGVKENENNKRYDHR